MSLFPLDLDRYKAWTIQQLYYLLFPYIKEDFMGRQDCQAVHTEGNLIPVVGGATGTITQAIRGGSDTFLSMKEGTYRAYVEEGGTTLRNAQEQGNFTGRAR